MTVWLSLGISLIAIAVAMILMRRMVDRRTGSAALLDEIRREVGAIVTELNQTTERNIELIEDRIRSLQETIGQADKRLSNLKREVERQEAATAVYTQLGRFRPPETGGGRADAASSGRSTAPAADDEKRSAPAAATVAEANAPAAASAASGQDDGQPAGTRAEGADAADENDRGELGSVKDRVMSLYRQGVSVERIASRVGTAVSEVELIVSLGDR